MSSYISVFVQQSIRRGVLTPILAAMCTLFSVVHAQIPGSFDTNFAAPDGKILSLPIGPSNSENAKALALQPDGKILMAGECGRSSLFNLDFCLIRLNADGTLDTTFKGPDTAGTGTGTASGKFILSMSAGTNASAALAVQPNGKIVVAGYCTVGLNSYNFCLARLNIDGSLDQSFDGPDVSGAGVGNGNGRVVFPVGGADSYATALVLQPDGKIVVAGFCDNGTQKFCFARLNGDGSFDTSFNGPDAGGSGQGTGRGRFVIDGLSSVSAIVSAIAVQPDGSIVTVGSCYNAATGYSNFCAVRLYENGSFDNNFNGPNASGTGTGTGSGKVLLSLSLTNSNAYSLAIQPDGNILIAGTCRGGASSNVVCLARLNPDGSYDVSFDGPSVPPALPWNGKVLLSNNFGATYITLQTDGKILLLSSCISGIYPTFCLLRLHSDGTYDTSFDGPSPVVGNGKFLLPIGTRGDAANVMAIQPDGKIVVAGYCSDTGSSYHFCVARANGGPFGARNCSMDIDGDGRLLATTDGLMLTRIMLGMTDDAVTNGITFAPNSSRTDWPSISYYLITQCGMNLQYPRT
jgi:uncharacterized delta-60 repeat protein